MADTMVGRHTCGSVEVEVFRAEAKGRAYLLARKDGQVALDTRDEDDGGELVKPWHPRLKPAGDQFARYTHIIRGRLPVGPEDARTIGTLVDEANRDYAEGCRKAGEAYKAGRKAAILEAAGGREAIGDIDANGRGGYAAYEASELRRGGRRDPAHKGDGLDHWEG